MNACLSANVGNARPRRFTLACKGVAALAGVLGWAAAAAGCGASYQSIYEGEVRFEHCYRLDEEPDIPLTQRRECWKEWTRFYTYGQTRDRLEYALKRQRELSGQIQNPGGSPVEADPSESARLVAPAPTSPFEPPPHLHSAAHDAGTTEAGIDPKAIEALLAANESAPGQRCMLGCLRSWHDCVGTCQKAEEPCRKTCDDGFRGCVSRCVTP